MGSSPTGGTERFSKAEAQALAHALDVAHGLLAPQGRQAAVEGLSSRQPPQPQEGSEHHPGPPPPNPAMDLFDALELDSDQHRAVRQTLGHPPHPRPPGADDFLSFARDDFDASALGIEREHLRYTAAEAMAEVELVAALVAVIDDDQLSTLCEFMRGGFVESSRSVHG